MLGFGLSNPAEAEKDVKAAGRVRAGSMPLFDVLDLRLAA